MFTKSLFRLIDLLWPSLKKFFFLFEAERIHEKSIQIIQCVPHVSRIEEELKSINGVNAVGITFLNPIG